MVRHYGKRNLRRETILLVTTFGTTAVSIDAPGPDCPSRSAQLRCPPSQCSTSLGAAGPTFRTRSRGGRGSPPTPVGDAAVRRGQSRSRSVHGKKGTLSPWSILTKGTFSGFPSGFSGCIRYMGPHCTRLRRPPGATYPHAKDHFPQNTYVRQSTSGSEYIEVRNASKIE